MTQSVVNKIHNPVSMMGKDSDGNSEDINSTNNATHTSSQNTSAWIWPNTLYTNSSASGATQTDNTQIYESSDVSMYNYHIIENTSSTDPVDVYISLDGTNYVTLAASVLLHDDVTTGGGVKVVTIPAGKAGILEGCFKKIKALKDGATAETPSIRYAHTVK